ncbi:hypothetical protein MXAZACID_10258 [Acidocella sp. MX-AZ02]|nr:hypothetical protein MXAZACID_10258 [Acidocella sp. MX-AZ02]
MRKSFYRFFGNDAAFADLAFPKRVNKHFVDMLFLLLFSMVFECGADRVSWISTRFINSRCL